MKSIIALAVTIALAITFTLTACDEKEAAKTTTEPAAAATKEAPQETAAPTILTDTRDNKTYKTVKIGEQVWMAENLNYQPKTGESRCYANSADSCKKYGRFYDWETAKMACPSGWHLPSKDEWQTLVDFAGGDEVAGKALKASSGWNDYEGKSGNGEDKYGFSALPGGYGHDNNNFGDVGKSGLWWTATEMDMGEDPDEGAYGRDMYSTDRVGIIGPNRTAGYSVRCIKD
jgi:uncharacterized protein (TIGR02145 family)